jgi:hypothetical protein
MFGHRRAGLTLERGSHGRGVVAMQRPLPPPDLQPADDHRDHRRTRLVQLAYLGQQWSSPLPIRRRYGLELDPEVCRPPPVDDPLRLLGVDLDVNGVELVRVKASGDLEAPAGQSVSRADCDHAGVPAAPDRCTVLVDDQSAGRGVG